MTKSICTEFARILGWGREEGRRGEKRGEEGKGKNGQSKRGGGKGRKDQNNICNLSPRADNYICR